MRRGESGLSLVVAVNKPSGMTSHDVVNRCRGIFGERRVGHTGTLDPLATGVLPICIGPATRLDRFMTAHDKSYRVTIAFGRETDTDDAEGKTTVEGPVSADLVDGSFAESYVAGLRGKREQVPPAYSAVKVAGRKAYEIARAGSRVDLKPRMVEVYEAALVDRWISGETGEPRWTVDFSVSKGTYIRALVRDMGRELGAPAHVHALERLNAGCISLEECMSLDTIAHLKERAALDPVRMLGLRFAYADGCEKALANGSRLSRADVRLYEFDAEHRRVCSCTPNVHESAEAPADGEFVSMIVANRLKALYEYSQGSGSYKPACVFSTGVARG